MDSEDLDYVSTSVTGGLEMQTALHDTLYAAPEAGQTPVPPVKEEEANSEDLFQHTAHDNATCGSDGDADGSQHGLGKDDARPCRGKRRALPSDEPPEGFTCARCFRSKVKCDRQAPCARCARMGVVCEPRPVRPGRPRKRPHGEENMLLEALGASRGVLLGPRSHATRSVSSGSSSQGSSSSSGGSSGSRSEAEDGSRGKTSPEPHHHRNQGNGRGCCDMDQVRREQAEEKEEEEGEEDRSWALAGAGGEEGEGEGEGKWWGQGAASSTEIEPTPLCTWQATGGGGPLSWPLLRVPGMDRVVDRGQQCAIQEGEGEEGLAQAAMQAVGALALEARPTEVDTATQDKHHHQQQQEQEDHDWAAVAVGLSSSSCDRGMSESLTSQPPAASATPPTQAQAFAPMTGTQAGQGQGQGLLGMGMGGRFPGFNVNAATLSLWAMTHAKQLQCSGLLSSSHGSLPLKPPPSLSLSLSLAPPPACPSLPAPISQPPPFTPPQPHATSLAPPRPPSDSCVGPVVLHCDVNRSPLASDGSDANRSPQHQHQQHHACHAALARYLHAALLPPRLPLSIKAHHPPHHKGPLPPIDRNKAVSVLRSWNWSNLLLGRDSTENLLPTLAQALLLTPLPQSLPDILPSDPIGSDMAQRLQCLFSTLSPDKAMCCVSWSVGRVSITTTERFVSVFMAKQAVEDAVVANALSPMHTWARLVDGGECLWSYWDLMLQCALGPPPPLTPTTTTTTSTTNNHNIPTTALNLRVRDRFGLVSWATARVAIEASPCGWHSFALLILEPTQHD